MKSAPHDDARGVPPCPSGCKHRLQSGGVVQWDALAPCVSSRRVFASALLRCSATPSRAARRTSLPNFFGNFAQLFAVLIASEVTQIIGRQRRAGVQPSPVGASSMCHFRTVVKDMEDTAFVIFAVVVLGMSAEASRRPPALVGRLWAALRPTRKADGSGTPGAGLDAMRPAVEGDGLSPELKAKVIETVRKVHRRATPLAGSATRWR